MPTIKSRQPRLTGVPQTTGARRLSGAEFSQVARADQQVGAAVQQAGTVANQLSQEHDANVASKAFNSYRTSARGKLTELRGRKGTLADGSMEEYNEWGVKNKSKFGKDLTQRQRSLFDDATSRKDITDLDSLAIHQATQTRAANVDKVEGIAATAINEIILTPKIYTVSDDFFDKDNNLISQGDLSRVLNEYESLNPGMDNTLWKLQFTARYRSAQLQALVDSNPAEAKKKVEEWKSQLGGAYQGYKDKIDQVELEGKSQANADIIRADHHGDYNAQFEAAEKIKDPGVRKQTKSNLRTRQADDKRSEDAEIRSNADNLTIETYALRDAGATQEQLLVLARKSTNPGSRKELESLVNSWFPGSKSGTVKTISGEPSNARLRIDQGLKGDRTGVLSEEQLRREYSPKVSASELDKLVEYWRNGGNIAEVSDSSVRQLFRSITGTNAFDEPARYDFIWDSVVDSLPPGTKPTDVLLREAISNSYLLFDRSGEREGSGFGFGKDISLAKAIDKGTDDRWLPDVTGEKKREIARKLKAEGQPVTDFTVRLHERVYGMKMEMTRPLQDLLLKEKERIAKVTAAGEVPAVERPSILTDKESFLAGEIDVGTILGAAIKTTAPAIEKTVEVAGKALGESIKAAPDVVKAVFDWDNILNMADKLSISPFDTIIILASKYFDIARQSSQEGFEKLKR